MLAAFNHHADPAVPGPIWRTLEWFRHEGSRITRAKHAAQDGYDNGFQAPNHQPSGGQTAGIFSHVLSLLERFQWARLRTAGRSANRGTFGEPRDVRAQKRFMLLYIDVPLLLSQSPSPQSPRLPVPHQSVSQSPHLPVPQSPSLPVSQSPHQSVSQSPHLPVPQSPRPAVPPVSRIRAAQATSGNRPLLTTS